jgi:hypothetical protein
VKPLMVTVNADNPIAAPDVSKTMEEKVVALHATARFGMLLANASTMGVTSEAKKADGKLRVIESPDGMYTVGVKASVTETKFLKAMRSDDEIPNDKDVTAL